MADLRGILKDKNYGIEYYEEHVEAGVDYLTLGEWHFAYARMVADMTLQHAYEAPAVLEAGCACGAYVAAYKRTGVFKKTIGIDVSQAMINLGRKHFDLTEQELFCGSIGNLPFADHSMTLVSSAQVLEHIPHEVIDSAISEFFRVLAPGGRMFHNLAALKHGDPKDLHDGDPTHVNVKPTGYWAEAFSKAGFLPDFESYDRYVRSKEIPGTGYPNFFNTYEIWTSFCLIKPS